MNFQVSVIGVILVLTLYLPGYFFRRFYFSGFATKQFGMGEWYDRFFMSIFLGILIQVITIKILRGFQFNFDSLSGPITSVYNNLLENKLPTLDYENFVRMVFYILVSMFFGCVSGLLMRKILRFTRLDIHTSTLKYANIWHYYFKGDIVKTQEFEKSIAKKGKLVFTRADILMDFQKDNLQMLYSGVINQYDLASKSEKLERIYLTGAKRYSKTDKIFKDIPGDILMLDAAHILNINLSYDYIEKRSGRKNSILKTIGITVVLLIIFSPFALIPYFLYSKIGLWRVILGMIESFLLLIFLISMVNIIATKKDEYEAKYKGGKMPALIVSLIITFVITFLIYITLF